MTQHGRIPDSSIRRLQLENRLSSGALLLRAALALGLVITLVLCSRDSTARPAAAAGDCVTVTSASLPSSASGGTIVTPAPNCPGNPNAYAVGTVIAVYALPDVGWTFADWSEPYATLSPDGFQLTVTEDVEIIAHFAERLSDNVARPDIALAAGEVKYFVLDVDHAATYLEILSEVSSGVVNLYVRRAGPVGFSNFDCYRFSNAGSCTWDNFPTSLGDQWFIMLHGVTAGTASLQASICWPVNITPIPAESTVTKSAENCPGGYVRGTEVSVTAVNEPLPAPQFLAWTDYRQFPWANPLVLTVPTDQLIYAQFGTRLDQPLANVDLPANSSGWFYVEFSNVSVVDIALSAITGEFSVAEVWLPYNGNVVKVCDDGPAVGLVCPGLASANSRIYLRLVSGEAPVSAVVESVASQCKGLLVEFSPPNSGRVELASDTSCAYGYEDGTTVGLNAIASDGYEFVGWSIAPGDIPQGTAEFDFVFNAEGDSRTIYAHFAREILPGEVVPGPAVSDFEYHYYFLDVPSGRTSLTAAAPGTPGTLRLTRFPDLMANPGDAACTTSTVPLTCVVPNPEPGIWWAVVSGVESASTVTMTFDQLCYALEVDLHPHGAADPAIVTPAPNCTDELYLPGTEVTIEVQPGYPWLTAYEFSATAAGSVPLEGQSLTREITMDRSTRVDVTYAERLVTGDSLYGIEVGDAFQAVLYFDLPAGVGSVLMDMDANTLVYLSLLSSDFSSTGCEEAQGTRVICQIVNPVAGRWVITLGALVLGYANLSVSTSPAINSTIEHLSPRRAIIGTGPLVLDVFGFSLSETSVINVEGIGPLVTQWIDPGNVRATLSLADIGLVPRALMVWVTDAGELPSNSLPLFFVSSSDVDCDGLTTSSDALFLLRVLAGFHARSCGLDANQDLSITLADVLWIRKEVAGLVTPLAPVPE